MSNAKYKRVLLKLSGEALAGEQKTGVNVETVGKICDKIKEIVEMGVQVAIVVGGGNFWRGRQGHQMERTTADYMGILATAMNGLALQDALEERGIYSRVQTAIEMRELAEPFILRKRKSSHLCRRNWTSILYNRYSSSVKSHRNQSRHHLIRKSNRCCLLSRPKTRCNSNKI